MEMNKTVTSIRFIQTLKEKGVIIFETNDLRKMFGLENENTINHLLTTLNEKKIIKRLKRGQYLFLFSDRKPSDFLIANSLVTPSYVSLESALSYYDFLTQFPYRITSISLVKPRQFNVNNKKFTYSRIKKEYFKDFIKIDDFLIGSKKKVLFDYFYFIYKGLRPKNVGKDLEGFLKPKNVKEYFKKNGDDSFRKFLRTYVKL